MRGLIQRVSFARVTVDNIVVGEIGPGILLLLGIEKADAQENADKMLDKLLAYRIFSDAEGKMNHSVAQAGGGVLAISQFTLVADTRKGLRPGFSSAASPADAENLYNYFCEHLRQRHSQCGFGHFGADMQVELLNDGPVTFLLET